MRLDVRGTNVELAPEVRDEARRRIHFALARFAPRIRRVALVVTDLNGPRGGRDMACRVSVNGVDGWRINVSGVDLTPARSIANAVARAGRVVGREIARFRSLRRLRRAS